MSKSLLFLILFGWCAFASEDAKQAKRGVVGNGGWIGLPNPYGHGHPWSVDHSPWKGLHLASALPTYGRGGVALTPEILKALPVYITKHVVLEKPVPVPQPVIIEKPYHVPVEKVIPVPIEKIVHKPVPIPVPVPQVVPIPVKQPIAVPVHQPYPVPVRHPVPVPVPVPIPVPVHPPPLHPAPLIAADGLAGAIYTRGYAPGHLYASPLHFHPPAVHLDHGFHAALAHGLHDHGFGHVQPHGYGHGYGYGYGPSHHDAHVDHHLVHDHTHDHKKRKSDKN